MVYAVFLLTKAQVGEVRHLGNVESGVGVDLGFAATQLIPQAFEILYGGLAFAGQHGFQTEDEEVAHQLVGVALGGRRLLNELRARSVQERVVARIGAADGGLQQLRHLGVGGGALSAGRANEKERQEEPDAGTVPTAAHQASLRNVWEHESKAGFGMRGMNSA